MVMTKETPQTSIGSSRAQHCTKFKTGKLPSPLFFCVIVLASHTHATKQSNITGAYLLARTKTHRACYYRVGGIRRVGRFRRR